MGKYPECFPEDFEERILPKGAKPENKQVYRIIKSGIIDRDSFISTYEEIVRGSRCKPKKLDLEDPGIYSVSCFMDLDDIEYFKNVFMRRNPELLVAKGITDSSCGPCQLTSERKPVKENSKSHVDWWVYQDANPQNFFEEMKINEK